MPDYAWTCQVCATPNAAGVDACSHCVAPSTMGADEITRRRRALGLDTSVEPVPGLLRARLSKARVWLPGLYAVIVAYWVVHTFVCGGDMCSLPAMMTVLPWSAAAFWLPWPVPGVPLLLLGFAANLYILYRLGRWWDKRT